MYKNILVPVSFEEEDGVEKVLKAASRLACEDARVTLLHVMPPVPKYARSYFPEGYQDEAKATLAKSLNDMARDLPNVSADIVYGNPGKVILLWVKDKDVDCVVMSSHKPGPHEFNLGSTAAQVVRHVTCAVHVAR
ncbi:universal stress protein [Cognatishimia maritima]|uniref:Nucleotide-binding universal stress protein, UspA family n=1 Tax=Cognatishimia maritima TaxID=870908 RepID=A0A1M5KL15_9RHOB|nr:universal stress protein [Cognatishimia maritima]SHG53169.1 Nucleotide-binding universal stress protein, UspA family [Cognatishimia maritima]